MFCREKFMSLRERILTVVSRINLELMFIVIVAALLRVYHLDAGGFWCDEQKVWKLSGPIHESDRLLWFLKSQETHLPLYFYLQAFWMKIFGSSEVALRSLSVFFSLLAVIELYRLGVKVLGRGGALIAASILACHPLWIHYSQEATLYSFLFWISTLAFRSFLELRDSRSSPISIRKPKAFLFTACLAALVVTHAFGILLALCLFLLTMVSEFRGGLRFSSRTLVVLTAALFLIAFSLEPYITVMLYAVKVHDFSWMQFPSASTVLTTMGEFFVEPGVFMVGILLLIYGWWGKANVYGAFLRSLYLSLPFLVALLFVYIWSLRNPPLFQFRYFFPFLAPLLLLYACLLQPFPMDLLRSRLIALVLGGVFIFEGLVQTDFYQRRMGVSDRAQMEKAKILKDEHPEAKILAIGACGEYYYAQMGFGNWDFFLSPRRQNPSAVFDYLKESEAPYAFVMIDHRKVYDAIGPAKAFFDEHFTIDKKSDSELGVYLLKRESKLPPTAFQSP